ncbi:hypothetical protein [Burkholderia glumae]|uniref:hypothetical protein n=1 Tax=Burkholderia glumae TaxID=337 RepID=UPI00265F299D|nr:hypothetical protein [Burkholderia glumae]MCM2495356.1 hypothetical protein [Burkholderia glumae]
MMAALAAVSKKAPSGAFFRLCHVSGIGIPGIGRRRVRGPGAGGAILAGAPEPREVGMA